MTSDSSDDTQSDNDLTWSPGDGICPTTAQFNQCCQSKHDEWRNAASICPDGYRSLDFCTRAFLDLLKDVPPFLHRPPECVDIRGTRESFLLLSSTLCIRTTKEASCDHPEKSINYLQCLGSPKPVIYNTKTEAQPQVPVLLSGNSLRSGYFTSIVLAWSYIISCRWVEILQQAGEDSQILHDRATQTEGSFWPIVTQGLWKARVRKLNASFYSPWMLRKEGAKGNKVDWVPVSADSSLAFDTLLSFCASEGLQAECLIGFASVLLLTSVAKFLPPPKFAPPVTIPDTPIRSPERQGQDMIIKDLFQSIDKCMFLSSTWDAAESLLCSAFFDPSVPCNLLGASSLGIRKAISIANTIDDQQLLNAITYMRPDLGLLWNAAICNDQANALLNMVFKGLPPICLVAAFLTNTNHTFLQIDYHSTNLEDSQVARANEFRTSFLCRASISVPWSPAPPFGATTVQNLSLQVRAHFAHRHKPLSWRLYWTLASGERIPASESHQLVLQEYSMCGPYPAGQTNEPPDPERNLADEQSGEATSRLFNWHRGYDDGLWLDEGDGDVELVRRLQAHPWVIDRFDSLESDPAEEPKHRHLNVEGTLQWISDVEKSAQSGIKQVDE